MSALGATLTNVLAWFGNVVSALVGEDGALAELWPLLLVGVSISFVFVGVKMVRKVLWAA